MRFALLEIKLTLVKILKKFDVLPGKNFSSELEIKEGVTRRPRNGISVMFRKREDFKYI